MADTPHLLIVEAPYYTEISEALGAGAEDFLRAEGVSFERISVPGALEIPAAIKFAAQSGKFDGYVALGCVIRGETYHFEIVAGESARALMDLGIGHGLPLGNGILTVDTEAQAWERARITEGDKGGGAARAALDLVRLKRRVMP